MSRAIRETFGPLRGYHTRMQYQDADWRGRQDTEEYRAQLRAVPPGVLYGLAAARSSDDSDWRERGAALLLQAAADDQVSARS